MYIAFATMAFCIDKEPKVDFLTHYVVYVLFRTAFVWSCWYMNKLIVKEVVVVQSSSEPTRLIFLIVKVSQDPGDFCDNEVKMI